MAHGGLPQRFPSSSAIGVAAAAVVVTASLLITEAPAAATAHHIMVTVDPGESVDQQSCTGAQSGGRHAADTRSP